MTEGSSCRRLQLVAAKRRRLVETFNPKVVGSIPPGPLVRDGHEDIPGRLGRKGLSTSGRSVAVGLAVALPDEAPARAQLEGHVQDGEPRDAGCVASQDV
jgi:hypothetical protein